MAVFARILAVLFALFALASAFGGTILLQIFSALMAIGFLLSLILMMLASLPEKIAKAMTLRPAPLPEFRDWRPSVRNEG